MLYLIRPVCPSVRPSVLLRFHLPRGSRALSGEEGREGGRGGEGRAGRVSAAPVGRAGPGRACEWSQSVVRCRWSVQVADSHSGVGLSHVWTCPHRGPPAGGPHPGSPPGAPPGLAATCLEDRDRVAAVLLFVCARPASCCEVMSRVRLRDTPRDAPRFKGSPA